MATARAPKWFICPLEEFLENCIILQICLIMIPIIMILNLLKISSVDL